MTTNTTKARREYESAVDGLVYAEELRYLLAASYEATKMNPYYLDARDAAERLVREMQDNVDDVMSRYSPEECGV